MLKGMTRSREAGSERVLLVDMRCRMLGTGSSRARSSFSVKIRGISIRTITITTSFNASRQEQGDGERGSRGP